MAVSSSSQSLAGNPGHGASPPLVLSATLRQAALRLRSLEVKEGATWPYTSVLLMSISRFESTVCKRAGHPEPTQGGLQCPARLDRTACTGREALPERPLTATARHTRTAGGLGPLLTFLDPDRWALTMRGASRSPGMPKCVTSHHLP